MLELTFPQASLLKNLVQALKEIKPVVTLQCSEQGINIMELAPLGVALFHGVLRSENFELFRCDKDDTQLGLSLEQFHKVLGHVPNNVPLTLRKEDNEDHLSLITDSAEYGEGHREAIIKLVDTSNDRNDFTIPEDKYSAVVDLPSNKLKDILKGLQMSSNIPHVTIKTSPDCIAFESTDEMMSLSLQIDAKGSMYTGTSCEFHFEPDATPLDQTYSLVYLTQFSRGCALSNKATLYIADGQPLRMRFALENTSFVDYYLAPRMRDDVTA